MMFRIKPFRRLTYVFMALFVLAVQGSAAALSAQQRTIFDSGIRYYDADVCSGTVSDISDKSASPGPVYIMGDSITELAKDSYQKAFKAGGWDPTVEGLVSRHIVDDPPKPSGLNQIIQDKKVISQANAVVVALGTNDTGFSESKVKSDVQQVMSKLKSIVASKTPIYWVNVINTKQDNDSQRTNQAIESAVGSDGSVIDWYSTAQNQADLSSFNQGVHPTKQKDINLLTNLVFDTVTGKNGSTGSVSSSDATSGCCDVSGSANLTGKDNEEKVWNYFKSKGLSDAQVAGIMGNMQQESSFDPERIQYSFGGGRSQDPTDAGAGGWGLIQWTPGSKIIDMAKQAGVNGPIYELATQLDLVWQHMHNHPVVTQTFSLTDFKQISDEKQASLYFLAHIEGGTDPGGVRESNATKILHDYAGVGGQSAGGNSGGCSSSTASPDCQNASGNAVILCEAQKYDVVSYVWGGGHAGGKAYHQACSTINNTDQACGLDCSGLVSVAVYDAFHNNKAWDTGGIASDTTNWKQIYYANIKAGDVIEPDPGHVEIIDHVSGGYIYTFGAHTAKTTQPKQVGPARYTRSSAYNYYRYVGQGA
jgi:hypothetical protein